MCFVSCFCAGAAALPGKGVVLLSCPLLRMLVPDLHICHSKQRFFVPGVSLRYSRLPSPVPALIPFNAFPNLPVPHSHFLISCSDRDSKAGGSKRKWSLLPHLLQMLVLSTFPSSNHAIRRALLSWVSAFKFSP